MLSDDNLVLINGVEFSCKNEGGKYHILGYGYRLDGKTICDLAGKTHQMRMEKARGRLKVLKAKYGYSFSDEDKEKLLSLDNPGKPHIGNLMVQYGYASSKDEAIENVLNDIHVHTGSIKPEEAILAIRESGGLAILAHPPFGNGSQYITGEKLKERILRLKNLGLDGLETWYSGYDAKLRGFCSAARLLVSVSSSRFSHISLYLLCESVTEMCFMLLYTGFTKQGK